MHLTSCQECSCEHDCQKFGTCCPDYTLEADIDVEYQCVDLDSYFNAPRGIFISCLDLKYHIIDNCQKSVPYSSHCENSTLLEDFIVVTDIKTGRIYKNKHCASCHGVDEYEEWGIFTICAAIDKLSFDTFEERDMYVVKYCPIVPYPPPSQAMSLYRCIQINPRYGFIEECKHTDNTHEVDRCIVNACERHSPYTNSRIRVGSAWFKNIYCFWCSNKISTSYSYLCEKPAYTNPRPSSASFTMILYTKTQTTSEMSKRCNESSILDEYTNSCLQLYCQSGSIPSFGKCSSVSDKSSGIYIATGSKTELNDSVEKYKVELKRNFITVMASKFGDEISCGRRIGDLIMKSTDVYLIYAVCTRGNCNRDFLMSYMWKLFNDSMIFNIEFNHSNATIEVKLTASIESHEVIELFDNQNQNVRPGWHNVLRSCARIDRRMVPMLTRMNSDMF